MVCGAGCVCVCVCCVGPCGQICHEARSSLPTQVPPQVPVPWHPGAAYRSMLRQSVSFSERYPTYVFRLLLLSKRPCSS